jgi:hypothetical protein
MHDDLQRIWKENAVTTPWQYADTYPEGLWKTMKTLRIPDVQEEVWNWYLQNSSLNGYHNGNLFGSWSLTCMVWSVTIVAKRLNSDKGVLQITLWTGYFTNYLFWFK